MLNEWERREESYIQWNTNKKKNDCSSYYRPSGSFRIFQVEYCLEFSRKFHTDDEGHLSSLSQPKCNQIIKMFFLFWFVCLPNTHTHTHTHTIKSDPFALQISTCFPFRFDIVHPQGPKLPTSHLMSPPGVRKQEKCLRNEKDPLKLINIRTQESYT